VVPSQWLLESREKQGWVGSVLQKLFDGFPPHRITACLEGQYLAFFYYYGKIHGRPPSEAEMQQYFRVSPPSVHQMILTLEGNGLIERTPGQARSIRLLIPREDLPDLV